jgi:hypothetical protein
MRYSVIGEAFGVRWLEILLANSNAPEARWILAGGETTGDCDHENPEPRQGRQTSIPDPALLPERGIVS